MSEAKVRKALVAILRKFWPARRVGLNLRWPSERLCAKQREMDLSNLPRATSDACRRPALRALAKLKVDRSRRDRSRAPRVWSPGSTVCRGAWHWRPDAQIIPDVLRRYLIFSLLVSSYGALAPGEQKRFEPLVVAPARRHDIGSQAVVERANIRDFLRRGRSQPATSQGIGIEKRTVRDHLCLHSHHLCVLARRNSAPRCATHLIANKGGRKAYLGSVARAIESGRPRDVADVGKFQRLVTIETKLLISQANR